MYLWHPTIAYFAIAFFVAAMLTEGVKLLTGKRFWGLVAKYHLLAAAIMAVLAIITGITDFGHTWGTVVSYRFLKAHALIGFFAFFIIQLLVLYRYFMVKMLPEKYGMIYLIVGGLGLGMIFGTSYLGREAVYTYGAGVRAAMLDFLATEDYIKHLYGIDSLKEPSRADSLRAAQYLPGADTLHVEEADTLAYHEQQQSEHGYNNSGKSHEQPAKTQETKPVKEHSGHH
jgi:uncharacterized membrane protein